MKKVAKPQGSGNLVRNSLQEQNNVKNRHDIGENAQLVFSFKKFRLQPIRIEREFNNFYKDEDQYVEKVSLLLGKALPLLSQERESVFILEKEKRDALHLHKISNKREIVEDILRQYNFSPDEIDNIFEGEEIYQLEVPYANGSTRAVFQRIDNKLSFLFMDPNHHVYFNDRFEEAKRALFYEYCPINKAQQCVRMDYLHTCFAFDFLDETKYQATWGNDYDPMKDVEERNGSMDDEKEMNKSTEIMTIAAVNDPQEAKRFFDDYDIPYEEITEGEEKGKLLVKPIRREDRERKYEAIKRLERSRLIEVTDHPNVFRDRNDQAIVTFSPYNISELPKNRPWLEMSEHSIYGYGTKTFVVRSNILEAEKQQKAMLKDLNEQIRRAEERVIRAKRDLDAAQAELDRELDKLAEMKKGRDKKKRRTE